MRLISYFKLLFILIIITLMLSGSLANEGDDGGFTLTDDLLSDETEQNTEEQDVQVPESGQVEAEQVDGTGISSETTSSTETTVDATGQTTPLVTFEGTTSEDLTWETNEGTITDFSMTNALFSLGSLIQGSFVSFSNENTLSFGSIFDASTFIAVLDEGGQVDIAQRNGFGNTGQVYITIDAGQIIQDEVITFIPDGDDPTYIYYNTTEIEFQDGSIHLLGESVTNNDNTDATTIVEFNEQGFTKIQLHPGNTYSNFDYHIHNTDEEEKIICKGDPLCDINIDGAKFTMKGKVNFSFANDTIYYTDDPNTATELNVDTLDITVTNTRPVEDITAYSFTGNHIILETPDQVYDQVNKDYIPPVFKTYISAGHDKVISLDSRDSLLYEQFTAHSSPVEEYNAISGAPVAEASEQQSLLAYVFILLGMVAMIGLYLEHKGMKRKKGQLTLFATVGVVLVIIILLFFYVTLSDGSEASDISLAQIESLDQAKEAVEVCIDDFLEETIYVQGGYGGYLDMKESFSSFDTTYELLSIEAMQEQLHAHVERNINDCADMLEVTEYMVDTTKVEVTSSFTEDITVSVTSLGTVHKKDDTVNTATITEREMTVESNFIEMYTIIEEMYTNDIGNPIESYSGYQITTIVSEDFSEQLLSINDLENNYVFQVTKAIL